MFTDKDANVEERDYILSPTPEPAPTHFSALQILTICHRSSHRWIQTPASRARMSLSEGEQLTENCCYLKYVVQLEV